MNSSENHFLNDCRRYTLALQIARKASNHGPQAELNGETIESHCKAWDQFWIRYFRERANKGIDVEIANPSSYGVCTTGVYYDLHDLMDNPELRGWAGKYLTPLFQR